MQTLYSLQNEKSWKSLLLTQNQLLLINQSYSSIEAFEKGFAEKGIFKTKKEININSISQLIHKEKDPTEITIVYERNNKEKLVLGNTEALQELVNIIATQLSFKQQVKEMSKLKACTSSLIGIVVTAFVTWIVYMDAVILESGEELSFSGRRVLYKKMFAFIAEKLGSTGSLIAGALVIAIFIYLLSKNLKNPPKEIVYSQQ